MKLLGNVVIRWFFCSAVLISIWPHVSAAEGNQPHQPQYDLSSYLPFDSGISTIRYATGGFGRYPYLLSMPGAPVRVSLDGVPLTSYSPFGNDLESVPLQLVKSYHADRMRRIDLETIGVEEEEPVSTIGFLNGRHRRSVVEYSFARKTGERSGLVFGGSSYGNHAYERTLKHTMRNYYLSLRKTYENGAETALTFRGSRDRDGLADLDSLAYMGERKTDHRSVAFRLKNYSIGETLRFSSTAWYQENNSRFHRHGFRKSLDDDNAGINIAVSGIAGDSEYTVSLSHMTRLFNSRIHGESWNRGENRINGRWQHTFSGFILSLNGGLLHSSEYGSGSEIDMELVRPGWRGEELVLRISRYDDIPDTGMEYYPSLTFSDSSVVSDLDMYTCERRELGWRYQSERLSWGLFGFSSDGEIPVFRPSSFVQDIRTSEAFSSGTNMSKNNGTAGGRWYVDHSRGEDYLYVVRARGMTRFWRETDRTLWMYPSTDVFCETRVSKGFLDDKLNSTVFGSMELLWWDDYYTGPEGGHVFLDCGISIKVSTLELFYKIENLTNEDVVWFDTFGRLGRNTMWGATWTLRN